MKKKLNKLKEVWLRLLKAFAKHKLKRAKKLERKHIKLILKTRKK